MTTLVLSIGLGLGLGALGVVAWQWRKALVRLDGVLLENRDLERRAISCEEKNRSLEERLKEGGAELNRLRETMRLEFETLNQRFLQESSDRLHRLSKESFQLLVQPFDQELKALQTRIHDVYDRESRERLSLKKELEIMFQAQQQMSLEAQSLTRALKGDVKVQGTWGEMVLERILESSGLREGEEFVVQGRGLGLKSESGEVRRPDVLINLPGGRHLIIDSKVSLSSYEEHIRADSEEQKQFHLQEFLRSIRRHLEELSAKNYQGLYGIQSPDFVLMFMPTDGAFALAHQTDPQLFAHAMEKRVAIVSPSLLFPNLRTVEAIWRQERQNRNAEEIARQAGNLYDKFVSFIDDLDDVGAHIRRSEEAYQTALNKLKSGRGNLIDRVEKLRALGAKTKKQLATELLSEGEASEDELA